MNELLVATNPDRDSRLGYLLRLPLDGGMVFRTSGTWPRTTALYCYPVSVDEWPEQPEIVERVPLRSCARRGAAIDLMLDRSRENRSQIVFSTARGRDAVFWQSPRTRKQARPHVSTRKLLPPASPVSRSSSIPESSTPTGSPANRPRPSRRPSPAVTTASRSPVSSLLLSSASPWPISCPA